MTSHTASHLTFAVSEPSQVGEVRRMVARLTQELGFEEEAAGRAALVATELGTNLVRHASKGRVLMAARRDAVAGNPCVEMLSIDEGPGMADVAACRRDGYSTAGTPGNGLGAIERMSDEFSIQSTPGRGTIAVARVYAKKVGRSPDRLQTAGMSTCAPGETVCGDAYSLQVQPASGSVVVADGLGHGPGAAEAAQAVVSAFEKSPDTPPAQLIERMHGAMRATRGAAVAVAKFDAARNTIVFAGAGNIAGRVVSGTQDKSLLSQHGTVGLQIRKIQDIAYDWPAHSLLILHSDGVVSRWTIADTPGLLQADPLVIAAWLLREHSRGRDDATVVVVRRP